MVHFNNPKLFEGQWDVDYDDYSVDSAQERLSSEHFGGMDIEREAKKLAYKLRLLSNEEVGVTQLQVGIASL